VKSKLSGGRTEEGGIFLLIFVAVVVGAILVAGVWVVLNVWSWAQRIGNNNGNDHAAIDTAPIVMVAAQTVSSPNGDIPAPPREESVVVLESTNLTEWTRSPLSLDEVLHNLNNRINLTNNACFYRIVYE